MVAAHICGSCRGVDLAALGIPVLTGVSEPDHCYGYSDRPAPEGVLGGYRCSCPCRNWHKAPDSSVSANAAGRRNTEPVSQPRSESPGSPPSPPGA